MISPYGRVAFLMSVQGRAGRRSPLRGVAHIRFAARSDAAGRTLRMHTTQSHPLAAEEEL